MYKGEKKKISNDEGTVALGISGTRTTTALKLLITNKKSSVTGREMKKKKINHFRLAYVLTTGINNTGWRFNFDRRDIPGAR